MAVGAPQDDACQIPSTNQNFGRSLPLHRRAPNVFRAGSVGVPQRMSRGLPECSAVACPTPDRTLSPTMPKLRRLGKRKPFGNWIGPSALDGLQAETSRITGLGPVGPCPTRT